MHRADGVPCWRTFGVVTNSNGEQVDLSEAAWLTRVDIAVEDQQPVLRFIQDQEAAKLLPAGSYETMVCVDLTESASDAKKDAH
ncbi:hypothetical protein Tcan_16703 [Toxocara canis]|uniref:Uncharacterized protein n=2 Tax=Toxocara canis TaxID=6265 RepID=A0A0B2VIA0_TOXCA|nr:hypothetical protein Tcan_16703 [Toxocara canis]VDM36935.1 unnamed protein product [Toxocara canis]